MVSQLHSQDMAQVFGVSEKEADRKYLKNIPVGHDVLEKTCPLF